MSNGLIDYFKLCRNDFPVLKRKIGDKDLIYVDNGATSLKPNEVIDAVNDFYLNFTANVHRGIHSMSEEATERFDEVRGKVKKFINAESEKEIIFTSGTTQSINLVGFGLAHLLNENDEIVISAMEHHANLVVWQEVCKKTGAKLKIIPLTQDYRLDMIKAKEIINNKTKILAITQFSNVLGTINPVKELIGYSKNVNKNIISIVDGAQSVPHMKVDIQDLKADFLSFSAHKMCGPSGVGVLYGKFDLLGQLKPQNFGGSMIYEVEYQNSTYNEVPFKFEAGTPNIEGVIGFGAAIDYLSQIEMEKIEEYDKMLVEYFLEKIKSIENLDLFGPVSSDMRGGVFSFNIKGIHPHDMSTLLDREGIAIRGGHHCAMPLMGELNTCATSRISLYFYNTFEEIDKIIEVLKQSKEKFDSGEFLLN
jgi:cysteine desulfurase/selenocysteine lyase